MLCWCTKCTMSCSTVGLESGGGWGSGGFKGVGGGYLFREGLGRLGERVVRGVIRRR